MIKMLMIWAFWSPQVIIVFCCCGQQSSQLGRSSQCLSNYYCIYSTPLSLRFWLHIGYCFFVDSWLSLSRFSCQRCTNVPNAVQINSSKCDVIVDNLNEPLGFNTDIFWIWTEMCIYCIPGVLAVEQNCCVVSLFADKFYSEFYHWVLLVM